MASYKLSNNAKDDLHRIWQHGLLQQGEVQADKYYFELISRVEDIADKPYSYPAVDNIRSAYRRSVFGRNGYKPITPNKRYLRASHLTR